MRDNDGVQVSGQRDAGKCSAVLRVTVTSWMCSQKICSNCMMLSCQYVECFVEYVPQRIKAFLEAKGGPTQY